MSNVLPPDIEHELAALAAIKKAIDSLPLEALPRIWLWMDDYIRCICRRPDTRDGRDG